MTILAEELHLLALDDRGVKAAMADLNTGSVGAILIDLTLAERVDLVDGKIVVIDPRPLNHPLLDTVLERLGTEKRRSPQAWNSILYWGQSQRVLDSMAARRLVSLEKRRLLGFLPSTRHLPTGSTRAEIQRRLAEAVEAGQAPDAKTAALAGLVHALNMEKHALPGHGSGAKKALKAVADHSWASDATRKAVEGTQAAVMAAITASLVVGVVAGGS